MEGSLGVPDYVHVKNQALKMAYSGLEGRGKPGSGDGRSKFTASPH